METEIIKGSQSEIKNALPEMKSTLEGINRVEEDEDQNTDIEDGEAKDIKSELQGKGN